MQKYQILGVIGEGAYGIVLKCRNRFTDQIVAIKKFKEPEGNVIKNENVRILDDELVRKTTIREVRILRLLKHDNIVNLIEAFRRKGKLYLVFEYVENNVLEILDDGTGLNPELVRSLTHQLIKAIAFCHQNNIVHRDIKPENLLVTPDFILKLCDFGFARSLAPSQTGSMITGYVATRWYRAPELLVGASAYGKPVDIWAIGCIMGELFTGKPVFPGESEIDQLFLIQRLIGSLTKEQQEHFANNQNFAGLKFPDVGYPITLKKKYYKRIPETAVSLMELLLLMDPSKRPTCEECLTHPYFEGLEPKVEGEVMPITTEGGKQSFDDGRPQSQQVEYISPSRLSSREASRLVNADLVPQVTARMNESESTSTIARSEYNTSLTPSPSSASVQGNQNAVRKDAKIPPRSVQHTRFGISKMGAAATNTNGPAVPPRTSEGQSRKLGFDETKFPEMAHKEVSLRSESVNEMPDLRSAKTPDKKKRAPVQTNFPARATQFSQFHNEGGQFEDDHLKLLPRIGVVKL